jgi:alpha-1,3-rhamnosyl/mannosyltransferase
MPRETLHDFYARAWGFVFPTLFEGFGLPILEALAAGIPSACSAVEPVAGIAGDAALNFDPYDIDAITEAMRRITGDESLRARLSEAGPRRAAGFPWRRTAERTLEALKDAAEL